MYLYFNRFEGMKIIKRKIWNELIEHLIQPEISLIGWARQVGKTTLMESMQEYLQQKGEKTVFLNLDYEWDRQYFDSQEICIRKIQLEIGSGEWYVFIDEIQRKENAWLFLKWMYDKKLPYKFIVSWSWSLELKEKIHESLAGRKRFFEMKPVDFEEFVDFKTDYKYSDKLQMFFDLEKEKLTLFLREYLNYGWYPRVVVAENAQEKMKIINEIFGSYVEKDIKYLLKIERDDAFIYLIKLLASQNGQLIKYNTLAQQIGISVPTLRHYLRYAERTFCIKLLLPFFKNRQKEILKSPIVYFNDIWLRNFSIGEFGNLQQDSQLGFLFQNLVEHILQQIIRDTWYEVHFRRTTEKAEVDFVLASWNKVIPLEVKMGNIKTPQITKSLRSFIEKYIPEKAFVVTVNYSAEILLQNTKIIFIPFWKLFSSASGISSIEL